MFRVLWLWVAACPSVYALTINVLDEQGQPLVGAVIEWRGQTDIAVAGAVKEQTIIMDQVNKRFIPELVIVAVGNNVLFPNSDNIRHHVYSFSPAKVFELRLYKGKPEGPIQFEQPGIVVLGCNIHDAMVGYIYVTDKMAQQTDASGTVEIPVPKDPFIEIWHPSQKMELHQKQRVKLEVGKSVLSVRIETIPPPVRDTFREKFQSHVQ